LERQTRGLLQGGELQDFSAGGNERQNQAYGQSQPYGGSYNDNNPQIQNQQQPNQQPAAFDPSQPHSSNNYGGQSENAIANASKLESENAIGLQMRVSYTSQKLKIAQIKREKQLRIKS
jgi:hypothetical protein